MNINRCAACADLTAPCAACFVAAPHPERFAHRDVRRTYHAEPFTDADLRGAAPTLRAPSARRKATR